MWIHFLCGVPDRAEPALASSSYLVAPEENSVPRRKCVRLKCVQITLLSIRSNKVSSVGGHSVGGKQLVLSLLVDKGGVQALRRL